MGSRLTNAQIADQLERLAVLLADEGGNPFKLRAYRRAAQSLRAFPRHVAEMSARGESLAQIPGVGEGISAAIREVVSTGSLGSVMKLDKHLPPGAAAIAQASGVSIREAKQLITKLGISTSKQLEQKLQSGAVAAIVGTRIDAKIRQRLESASQMLWRDASRLVDEFGRYFESQAGVKRVLAAGSYRRGAETVGALAFVIETTRPATVRAAIRRHAGVDSVTIAEPPRLVSRLATGHTLTVRTTTAGGWGDAVAEETGSAAHLAEVAAHLGTSRPAAQRTEEAWYGARGLPLIAPELREGRGEVAAALEGTLPQLVTLSDIRGDLHAHTVASDGAATIEEMVAGARARGYSYLAITDHSKSLKITNGLDEHRLREQMRAIDRINGKLRGFRVLKGSEVDILENGDLDFSDAVLRDLDIVICSIHSRFGLDRRTQTERLVRAIANPYTTCIGHLTGRKLLRRPGYDLDIDAVFRAVKQHNKLLEINSSPDRLDVDDEIAFRARREGVPLLINTDAHSVAELGFMEYGVQQARRGWQSADTVVNTLTLPRLLQVIAATRPTATRTRRR